MKIKTSELIGAQLDWAVTSIELKRMQADPNEHVKGWVAAQIESGERADPYSSHWLWGGPIIERAFIHWGMTAKKHGETPTLYLAYQYQKGVAPMKGSTPLIAAMRCYAASHLGDEVEVPDNLT